jgi:hypothetical protein
MPLRRRFGITGSHREVSGKSPGNIGKVLERLETFWTSSKLYQ